MNQAFGGRHVPVVGPHVADGVIVPLVDELRALGLEVERYADVPSFLKDDDRLADVDVLVATPGFQYGRDVMAIMPKLRCILSPVTGFDGFDLKAATELGVLAANSAVSENYESMTEATMLLMLAALYDLPGTIAAMGPNYPKHKIDRRMLRDNTVGIIGYGKIGQSLVKRLVGWQVNIQVSAPRLHASLPPDARHVGLRDLMATSDIICVVCSLNDQTHGMITAELLKSMKTDAVLVNVARGEIIDEPAMIACRQARPDIRLALDAFAVEPLPMGSPLRGFDNVILTPHALGHTREGFNGVRAAAIDGVKKVLTGQLPTYVLNPDVTLVWTARWGGGANA